jgi:hypothetical protein
VADETRRSQGVGFKGALAWIAILGLLALVLWLVSERNARTWYLVPEDGRVVVMRGVLFPVGRQTFKTADSALAQVYEPVVAPPGKALPEERSFDERSLLDQGLYDLLASWAREEIASGEPGRLERGLAYLSRAERLPGISAAQRQDLASLRAESGYYEAQRLLERATSELRDAAEKLRTTADSRSPHSGEARALLHEVEPAVEASSAALRAAPHPPPPQPAPQPTSAPPQGQPAPAADAAPSAAGR